MASDKQRKPNAILRWQRDNRGWSLRKVADLIYDLSIKDGEGCGITGNLVSRWERSEIMPSPFYREKLCQVFELSAVELGLLEELSPVSASSAIAEALPMTETTPPSQATESVREDEVIDGEYVEVVDIPKGAPETQELNNPMDQLRRKFLQEAGVVLFPLFFGSGRKSILYLDKVVSHSSSVIKACWHMMKGKEIDAAEELLSAYTPTLLNLTFQSSPYQQAIAQIATQACMIRAIIAKHHLNPIAREMYCHEAIQCSRLSGDKALYAGALMYLGYTYTFCNPLCPQKAIEIFLEALRELEIADNLVKSDICIGLADAYALVNDESQAKRAIHIAQDCFPSHPELSASFFYADCALDTLYQWEAKMYLDLGQHNQQRDYYKNALSVLEQSTRIHAVSERCMIETVIYQTTAALGLHDLDTYAFGLKEGASTALQIGSQRRYQEAFDLFRQAPKAWKQEQQLQKLTAFFQEQSRREKQT
ncbi:MAG: helix-turn-helix transcriptional regulator [Ktedonobacteraceae bacterium]